MKSVESLVSLAHDLCKHMDDLNLGEKIIVLALMKTEIDLFTAYAYKYLGGD